MGKKTLALRLRSLSTWLVPPLVLFSPPMFYSARRRNGHLIRTISNRQTNKDKRNKTQAEHPSLEFPPEKEKIPIHPLFKAVAPLLSPRGQIACFFCQLAHCFQVCDSSAGKQCLMRQTVLKFGYRSTSR